MTDNIARSATTNDAIKRVAVTKPVWSAEDSVSTSHWLTWSREAIFSFQIARQQDGIALGQNSSLIAMPAIGECWLRWAVPNENGELKRA
jgi:hypothetical protein